MSDGNTGQTTNREAAIKNAINRSVSFNNILNGDADKDSAYKILKINGNAYYKIFLNTASDSYVFEILGKQIFHVAATNPVSFLLDSNGYFYISGITAETIDLAIDFFDTFEFCPGVVTPKPDLTELKRKKIRYEENGVIIEKEVMNESDILNYYNNIITDSIVVDGIMDVTELDTKEISIETLKIGDWSITVGDNGSIEFC